MLTAPTESTHVAAFDGKFNLEPGHIFEGKYRILRELGSGGFGMVYLAQQISMDRPVALKVLKPGVSAHAPSARQRFLREVQIISKLRHPNTVTIHDYGETVHGVVYMVLEYVEGKTLKDLLQREGAQEPLRALGIARQIARSLAEAHSHGIVHRDLKPANIMLAQVDADSDFVKVLDFGVARLLNTEDADLTSAGVADGERALIGTPRYMSPEQVRGENLTGTSDLYSLGLVTYEMLVGEPAVQGDTTMGLIGQQLSPEPLRLPSLQALPPSLQQLLRRATDKAIARRFQNADEFARAIDATALSLTGEFGAKGRAATGAYFASTGRFSAIPRSGAHRPLSGAPFSNITSGPHHAATPSDTAYPATPSGSLQPVLTTQNQAPAGQQLDWYESQFNADDMAQNARANAPAKDAPDPNFPLMRNQVDYEESNPLLGIPSSELPLPPDAAGSPFAEPEPEEPEAEVEHDPMPLPTNSGDDNLVAFAAAIIKICLLATLAVSFLYLAFLSLGALVGRIVDDNMIRIVISAAVALAIPIFTALGENSQKERFDVVVKPTDRLVRIFLGTTIFAAATAFLISITMPGTVTEHLRNDPNWMFQHTRGLNYEPTAVTMMNRRVSAGLADVVEAGTSAIGRYDGTPTSAQDAFLDTPPPSSNTPPAPTRPGTRRSPVKNGDASTAKKNAQEAEPASSNHNDKDIQAQPPHPRSPRTTPPPTRPATQQGAQKSDDEYIRW